MKAGPTLDGEVARRLWRAIVFVDLEKGSFLIEQGTHARTALPPYSTDLDEAHRVVRLLQSQGYTGRMRHEAETGVYRCVFTKNDSRTYTWTKGETLPEAICLAAIAAVDNKNIVK